MSMGSVRADSLMHQLSQLEQECASLREKLAETRRETAQKVFNLARRIAKRDGWFIGGCIGDVIEEWEEREAKI